MNTFDKSSFNEFFNAISEMNKAKNIDVYGQVVTKITPNNMFYEIFAYFGDIWSSRKVIKQLNWSGYVSTLDVNHLG